MSDTSLPERWKTALPGLAVTGLYSLGLAFPGSFWGLHYPAFLPSGFNYLLFFLALVLAARPLLPSGFPRFPSRISRPAQWLLILGITGFFGWSFSHFIIASHCYGDAQFVYANLDGPVTQWQGGMIREVLFPSFTDIKTGIGAYYALVSLLAFLFEVNATEPALWVATACGMGFVFIWMSLVFKTFRSGEARAVFAVLGLGAPFLQVYFGHYEVYAVPMTLDLGFLYLLVRTFESGRRLWLALNCVVAYFAMKFHFANLILLPALLMSGLHVYRSAERNRVLLSWKGGLILFVVPICVLGGIFYFFLTQSAFGPRQFTRETIDEVVFLPLRAFENAPLDRYNLLSGAHLFDYFNLFFLLSGGALVLIAVAAWTRPARIDWKSPLSVATGITLGLFLIAFFVFNPLMSMPVDWDLMSLPGPALLGFVLVLWRKVDDRALFARLLGPVLGLSLLGASAWWVNSHPAALSQRLEQVGYHGFRTYRMGMSTTFEQALELEPDSARVPERLQGMIEALEADAVKGNDVEYAALLVLMGEMEEGRQRDLPEAAQYYERAVEYDPNYARAVYKAVVAHFLLGEFQAAAAHLPALTRLRYPSREKSLRIAIHTSLEAAQYKEAAEYCRRYLEKKPTDDFIRKVHEDLQKGEDLGQLKFRFSRSG